MMSYSPLDPFAPSCPESPDGQKAENILDLIYLKHKRICC